VEAKVQVRGVDHDDRVTCHTSARFLSKRTHDGFPGTCSALPLALVAVLLNVGLAVSAVLLFGPVEAYSVLVVDDLSQVAPPPSPPSARLAARRDPRRPPSRLGRAGRRLRGLAVGQSIWSWYELVLHDGTPFPSVADVGFLGFPVGATAALLLYPAVDGRGDRSRRVLDGLTVTSALALVSWSSALGPVVRDDSGDWLATTVSIAYPASDLVALSLVVLLLSRRTPRPARAVPGGLGHHRHRGLRQRLPVAHLPGDLQRRVALRQHRLAGRLPAARTGAVSRWTPRSAPRRSGRPRRLRRASCRTSR
jgi:hypothetical protein